MRRAGNGLVGIIDVRCGDVDTVTSLRKSFLRDELKDCLPVTAIIKTFLYFYKNETVSVL